MKKSRFTESQILAILTEGGSGIPVVEVCREHGISSPAYYQWKSKYAGMSLPRQEFLYQIWIAVDNIKAVNFQLSLNYYI